MQKSLRFLALLLAAILAGCSPESQVGQPRDEKPRTSLLPNPVSYTGEVSVACWNLEWFPGGSPDSRTPQKEATQIDAVAKILDDENPAILVACEVRDLSSAVRLNERLKTPYPYIAVTDYEANNSSESESMANQQESAIFSRIPWTDIWEDDFGRLPAADDRPSRGFIRACFVVNNRKVAIYGVHLKSNYIRYGAKQPELTALRNVEKRERGATLLLEDIRHRRGLNPLRDAIILCGDFNTDLYAERFQGEKTLKMILQAGFFNSFEGLGPDARVTIPKKGKWPDATFDYVLTSVGLGQAKATVIQRGAKGRGHASDHYMVKAPLPRP